MEILTGNYYHGVGGGGRIQSSFLYLTFLYIYGIKLPRFGILTHSCDFFFSMHCQQFHSLNLPNPDHYHYLAITQVYRKVHLGILASFTLSWDSLSLSLC